MSSINAQIEKALDGKCKNIWPMVCPLQNKPDEYIVYNPEITTPEDFGDDAPGEWVQSVQVHLYMKGNYLQKKKDIRTALLAAGFMIADIVDLYETDSQYNHIAYTCEKEES